MLSKNESATASRSVSHRRSRSPATNRCRETRLLSINSTDSPKLHHEGSFCQESRFRANSATPQLSPSGPYLYISPGLSALCEKLVRDLVSLSFRAIGSRGFFAIAVSGGSVPSLLSGLASEMEVEWDKWHIFLCDERFVPDDDSQSNIVALRSSFLKNVAIPNENIHQMKQGVDIEEAAINYQHQIWNILGDDTKFPQFDAVVLGCGTDGHVASIFPGHSLIHEETKWVLIEHNSPKLPPQRITLSLPVLNSAKVVMFAIVGEAKASLIKKIFYAENSSICIKSQPFLPCTMVKPISGQLIWYLDNEASSLCSLDVIDRAIPLHENIW